MSEVASLLFAFVSSLISFVGIFTIPTGHWDKFIPAAIGFMFVGLVAWGLSVNKDKSEAYFNELEIKQLERKRASEEILLRQRMTIAKEILKEELEYNAALFRLANDKPWFDYQFELADYHHIVLDEARIWSMYYQRLADGIVLY